MGARARRPDPLWHGYLRPPWRDLVLWMALGLAVVAMVPQVVLLGVRPADALWWLRLVLQGALTAFVVVSIVGAGAGITRGWEQGLREGRQRR